MVLAAFLCGLAAAAPVGAAAEDVFADAFAATAAGKSGDTALPGWTIINASSPAGDRAWARGPQLSGILSRDADGRAFASVNYESAGPGGATADCWLISPPLTLDNGQAVRFDARGTDAGGFPDRLQVRLDVANGADPVGAPSTLAARFSSLMLDVNPAYANPPAAGAFPTDWTPFSAPVSGLAGPVTGRLAFRYFVEDSGIDGSRGSEIGIDNVRLSAPVAVPEPASAALLAVAGGLARRTRRAAL